MENIIEVAKILLSFITPVIVLILGVWAKKIATKHEKRLSLNDKIIEKRVAIYEEIGKDLNDIYTFLLQIGNWKDFTPAQIVQKKRNVDKIMYVNRPYWSNKAFSAYMSFMSSGFEMFTGVGEDAKLKTITYQFKSLPNWEDDWQKFFFEEGYDNNNIVLNYQSLMKEFSEQFGFVDE